MTTIRNIPWKAIVTDLDGTLLNDHRVASKKDVETLHQLGLMGIIRIINTGRSLYSYRETIPNNFPVDFLIFAAGAGIMNCKTREIIDSKHIEKNDVREIVKALIDLQIDFQVRLPIPNDHKYLYRRYFDYNPDFDRLAHIYSNHIRYLDNIENLGEASRIISISPNCDILEKLSNIFHNYQLTRATSPIDGNSVWMELYANGVNKGSALKSLCTRLGIKVSQTIGIGNDFNDIDFLDITGNSFITRNAPADLKKKYNVIVSNNESPITFVTKSLFVAE